MMRVLYLSEMTMGHLRKSQVFCKFKLQSVKPYGIIIFDTNQFPY